MRADRLVSGAAMATYAAIMFAWLWQVAHAWAHDRDTSVAGVLSVAVGLFLLFGLPLLVGFAIGRWWAPAIVLWLILAARVADGLEPERPLTDSHPEIGGEGLAALMAGLIHIVLLLAGAGLRKLLRPRPPPEPLRLI